jgi:hypothetical protein
MKKWVFLIGWLLNFLAAIILLLFAYTIFPWQESAKLAYGIASITEQAKPISWIGASLLLLMRWLLTRKSPEPLELSNPLWQATAVSLIWVLCFAMFLTSFLDPNPWIEIGKDGQYVARFNEALRAISISELKTYVIRHNLVAVGGPIWMTLVVFRNKWGVKVQASGGRDV